MTLHTKSWKTVLPDTIATIPLCLDDHASAANSDNGHYVTDSPLYTKIGMATMHGASARRG